MNYKNYGFPILCIFFLITILNSQNISNKGDYGGISYFTNFTTENGLALSGIASSAIDQFGNLWFGTYGGGVSRYDGKTFTNYTFSHGLASNVILSIYEDSKGNLWFGSNREGVTKYDGKKFTTYTKVNGLADNTIFDIVEDKDGNIWFGTYGGGVSKFDGKKFKNYTTKNGLTNNNVRKIYARKDGSLWFATIGGGISIYDGKSFTNIKKQNGLVSDTIFSIIEDKNGALWFSSLGKGITKYDGKTYKTFSKKDGLASDTIWCSYKDKSNNLWFGTYGGGLSRFDGNNFTSFTTYEGLPNNFVYTMVEDKNGYLWLGTYGGGISMYNGQSIITYSKQQGLSSNLCFSILEDSKGNYWFGTYGNGVNKFSPSKHNRFKIEYVSSFSKKNGLLHNDVKSIFEDSKGNIWLGTIGGGVSKVSFDNGIKFTNYTTKNGLPNDRINWILEDKNGYLWFCTAGGGISKFDGIKFINYSVKDGLAHNIVLTMIEDYKGNLWFGSYGGVSKYDGITFINYNTENGLAHNTVFSILEDKDNNIWFGTHGGGVSKFVNNKFYNYTQDDGLSNNTIAHILQDSNGRIFFGTNQGISVLVGWKEKKPIFEIFNDKTGYPLKDVNAGQRGMYMDSNDIIWITSGNDKTALLRFDYKKINKSTNKLKLIIEDIRIKEKKINWFSFVNCDTVITKQNDYFIYNKHLSQDEKNIILNEFAGITFEGISSYYPIPNKLVLPYKNNHITFEFVAIEPTRPYLVNYQYKLEGYDEDWSPISNKTTAVFGNINEGTYKFMVKAQSPDGIWSDPTSYTFTVLPPWYRTYWAYLGYFLVILILIYLTVHLNSLRLHRANINLEKIVNERTNEINLQNEELKIKSNQIQLQKSKLEELNSSKDKFFRIIAHDLRSPLSGLINLTNMMVNHTNEFTIDEFSQISQSINSSATNVYKLLDNLLDWASIQQGEMKIKLAEHSLTEIIINTTLLLKEQAEHKKIKILNKIETDIVLIIDEKMINTVLRNLLSNAIKFTYPNGKITIDAIGKENYYEFSVKDNGIGISKDVLNKLFKIDIKHSEYGTENEPGTGLGLILCKEFIEMHNGKIWVESTEGIGTKFYFTLLKNNIFA